MKSNSRFTGKRSVAPILGLAYAIFLVVGLLLPFDFQLPQESRVEWLPSGPGVEFFFLAGIRSITPTARLRDAIVRQNGFAVEVWAATSRRDQIGPARIASYSRDPYSRNFTLGQQHDTLVVRLRTTRTDLNGLPPLLIDRVFGSGRPAHIVLTFEGGTARVFVDGQMREESVGLGDLSNWNASYPLVFGNEATGDRSWSGRLFFAAIHDGPLSATEIRSHHDAGWSQSQSETQGDRADSSGLLALYRFQEGSGSGVPDESARQPLIDLRMVSAREMSGRAPLFPGPTSRRDPWHWVLDVVANVLIFVPAGVFLSLWFARHLVDARLIALFATGAVLACSLTVEVAQYFSLVRYSSWIDVLANTFGATVGAVWHQRRGPRPIKMLSKISARRL